MLDEKILRILKSSREHHISGEDLCKTAGVSRAAIWKHIEKLRDTGYEIEASPHIGYRLVGLPDRLIPEEIRWRLGTKIIGREVISYNKVDSTNTIACALAEKGMKEGAVIIAEEQGKGKGRHGREWVSPPGSGIYMSCILRPAISPNEIACITLLAAVCVTKAIRSVTGLSAMIKWPNDILINNRKICGILTEMKAEQDRVDFIVLGIGINVNTKAKALPKGASSIKEELAQHSRAEEFSRVSLAKAILSALEDGYNGLKKDGFGPIIDDWKHLTAMLGSRIKVVLPGRTIEGLAHDLASDGSLVVRLESGVLQNVSSGDVVMAR